MSEEAAPPSFFGGLITRVLSPHRPLLALVLLALALYLPSVWLRDPWSPDEPRYAEVAREMVSRGDYILPHLNGEVYGEKPPLFFWLGIAAGMIPGVPFESGPRLVSVLAALLTLVLTFRLGRRFIDAQTGWLAALVLLTSSMFVMHATSGVIDGTLTLLVTAAIASGLAARKARSPLLWGLFYVLAGLAIITKGPVGLAIPAGVLFLVGLQEVGPRRAWAAHPLWGLAIMGLIGALWLVPAIARGGREYAEIILFKQNVGRAYQSWHHKEPFWYFLMGFPVAFVPWILLFPGGLFEGWRRRAKAPGARIAISWFLFTFVFFSVISGKKTRYLMPLLPAASLLAALELRALLSKGTGRARAMMPGVAAAALCLAGVALAAAPAYLDADRVALVQGLSADQVEGILRLGRLPGALLFILPGMLLAALGARSLMLAGKDRRQAIALLVSGVVAVVAWSQWVAVPALDLIKSTRPLAEVVQRQIGPAGAVVLYRESFQGVFNLHLKRDAIPTLSGQRRIDDFIVRNPGAVVIATQPDLERLIEVIPALRPIHCRRIGEETVCAATAAP